MFGTINAFAKVLPYILCAGASGVADGNVGKRLLPLAPLVARGVITAERAFPLLMSWLQHASWMPQCSLVGNAVACTADSTTAAVAALLLAWGAIALLAPPINALRRLKARKEAEEEGIAQNQTPETSLAAR